MNNLTQVRAERAVLPTSATRTETVVALLATGLAVLVWAAAAAAGIDLHVRSGSGSRPVGPVAVIVTAIAVAAAAAGLLRLLERRTSRSLRTWTIVAVTVWVVSFVGPLSATTRSAGSVLATLHLVVGAVVVVGLRLSRVA